MSRRSAPFSRPFLPSSSAFVVALGCACGSKPAAPSASASIAAPSAAPSSSATVAPSVVGDRMAVGFDPRVELFAIVFHVAENPSYTRAKGDYADAVDEHFRPFKDHPAVKDAIALRKDHGIGFNAPMDFALHVGPDLAPLVPLSPPPPDLDPRWKGVDVDAFLHEVADFRKVSGFDDFYAGHRKAFAAIEERFRAFVHDKPIVPWFDTTFGPREGASYAIVPGLLTWPMCYGVHTHLPGGREDVRAIMFLEQMGGTFTPGDTTLELVAHEIAHTYVNPVVDDRFGDLEADAKNLFSAEESKMMGQAYTTPAIMTKESIVRALVVVFLRDRGDAAHAKKTIGEEEGRGFVWTSELADAIAAAREKGGGKLTTDALVGAAKSVFSSWRPTH